MLRKIFKIFGITLLSIVGLLALTIAALAVAKPENFRIQLPVEHKTAFIVPDETNYPPALHAEGSRLVNPAGQPVRLRGVMIPDPYRLDGERRFTRNLIAEVQASGANVIRVPVHPEYWQRDKDYLWRYLDPVVTWAGDAGLYVIIDLHFIGNITSGAGDQMPDLDQPAADFADSFWISVASYFSTAPHVLLEIWNEPADINADDWRSSAAHLVKLIRAQGANQPLIIGGLEYSRDLSWVLQNPLEDANLAYAAHIYPAHSQGFWPRWFGDVAQRYPVIVSEWGYLDVDSVDGPAYLKGSWKSYGEPLVAYLDALEVSWVACWYDDEWLPPMFNPGRESLSEFGQAVLAEFKR